jgi:transcription elongation GreA/GreB family factor
MQAVLMRRKSELEAMLHRARGTNFENPDTSQVSIGTIVRLRDVESAKEETYTILGAWDSDPDRGVISYQTAIGQALLGRAIGDVVTLNSETAPRQYEIRSIEPGPIDIAPAEAIAEAVGEPAVAS